MKNNVKKQLTAKITKIVFICIMKDGSRDKLSTCF